MMSRYKRCVPVMLKKIQEMEVLCFNNSACSVALQRAIGEASVLQPPRPGFPSSGDGPGGGGARGNVSRALRHGRPNPAPTLVEISYNAYALLLQPPSASSRIPSS